MSQSLKMSQSIKVSIWRGAQNGRYQNYDVPQRNNQTVLDLVSWLQRHVVPDLAYRFSCRVGVCGSCAMSVNGRPRWTCRTHVAKVVQDGALQIGPLANLPVIKDLAVDMTPFFDKWHRAHGSFKPGASRHDPMARVKPGSPQRMAVDDAIECINCGVCYAACDTVRWNAAYLGPAALNRAWSLLNDERDSGHDARLGAISAAGGCQNCHSHQTCEQLCPKALNPARSIAGLKRRAVAGYLKGSLS